jgi:HK97 family phage portal protein
VALFFRGAPTGQQRADNLPLFLDAATGGRRGLTGRSHRHVSWRHAMSIPAVWAAVRLRANVISSLPVGVYRDRGGVPERVTGTSVPTVLGQPSATFDMVSWLHASQMSLDLRGNAYGRIVARDEGRTWLPTQIELVHPDDVHVRLDRDGQVEYKFAGKVVPTLDVWHERQNEEPGAIVGASPITAAARALGISLSAEDYGGGFYDEALTPSGLLSSDAPIDETQAKIVKARVQATQQGREPLVLGGNWSYKPLSITPADAAYLEVLARGDVDVARLFDVPGELIEANTSGSSVTYANREQRVQDLLAFRLGPAIARRERALTRLTVRGQYVKLNTAALLRGDLPTRYASYKTGLDAGFLDDDEVRALEDREPLPGVGSTDLSPSRLKLLADVAGTLIRGGFEPTAVATSLGLPIEHTGHLPVTVQALDDTGTPVTIPTGAAIP